MLWEVEVAQHRARHDGYGANFGHPGEPNPPYWTEEGLAIAEAIRRHHHVVRIGVPDHSVGDAAYATYLDHLRQVYGQLIQIVPADTDSAEKGRQEHRHFALHRSRQATLNARIANIPIPAGIVGQTLYHAIEAYAESVTAASQKEGAKVEAANARRLMNGTPDMDLSEFGFDAMERLKRYWTSRPPSKAKGRGSKVRPIALTTVDNHLSTARRFVRWLDRTDRFTWQMPRNGLDALRVNFELLRTPEETALRRYGVKTFTVEQLTHIYRHATDFERLLVVLGLNIGGAQLPCIRSLPGTFW